MALLTLENNVEDYLKDIEIENFDESMSFMDCAYYAIAEGERMWNDIMKEMAIEELRYLSENGVEMIYEAKDGENFFNKAINAIKKLASKIMGMFKKAFEWIEDHISRCKAYVKKHEKDIKAGHDLIPADGIEMKTYYSFENLGEGLSRDTLSDFMASANSNFGYNKVIVAGVKADTVKENLEKIKDKDRVNNALGIVRSILAGSGSESLSKSEFKKKAAEYYMGAKQENVKLVKSDIKVDDIIDTLKNCTKGKRDIKEAYNKVKKDLNQVIKEINTFKKNVEKTDEARADKLAYSKCAIQLFKLYIQTNTLARGVMINAHKAKCSQALSISTKLVKLAKDVDKAKGKEEKKEEVKESFTYQWEDGMNFFTSDLL